MCDVGEGVRVKVKVAKLLNKCIKITVRIKLSFFCTNIQYVFLENYLIPRIFQMSFLQTVCARISFETPPA